METKSKEIKLKYPIMVNGKETQIITVGRMKTKHLKALPIEALDLIGGDVKSLNMGVLVKMVPLFAGILNITEEEAGEIDIVDLLTVSEIITDSLGN